MFIQKHELRLAMQRHLASIRVAKDAHSVAALYAAHIMSIYGISPKDQWDVELRDDREDREELPEASGSIRLEGLDCDLEHGAIANSCSCTLIEPAE